MAFSTRIITFISDYQLHKNTNFQVHVPEIHPFDLLRSILATYRTFKWNVTPGPDSSASENGCNIWSRTLWRFFLRSKGWIYILNYKLESRKGFENTSGILCAFTCEKCGSISIRHNLPFSTFIPSSAKNLWHPFWGAHAGKLLSCLPPNYVRWEVSLKSRISLRLRILLRWNGISLNRNAERIYFGQSALGGGMFSTSFYKYQANL